MKSAVLTLAFLCMAYVGLAANQQFTKNEQAVATMEKSIEESKKQSSVKVIGEEELPSTVKLAFQRDFPGAIILEVVVEGGVYDIAYEGAGRDAVSVLYDKYGNLLQY